MHEPVRHHGSVWALLLSFGIQSATSSLALAAPSSATLRAMNAENPDTHSALQVGLEEPPAIPTPLPVFERRGAHWRVTKAGVIRGDADRPMYELDGGIILSAEAGDSRIELQNGIELEPHVLLIAPQGQTIAVGSNSRILASSNVIGHHAIGANVTLSATCIGRTVIGDGTVFSRGSATVVQDAVLCPILLKAEQETITVPVKVTEAASIRNSLVMGSFLWQQAVVLNSVVSLANLGNHVMLSRSAVYGASPQNRVAVAHHNDFISLFAVPLTDWRDLHDASGRRAASEAMTALRFGRRQQRIMDSVLKDDGHATNAPETLSLLWDGRLITVKVQGLNFGAGATTSNFDPRQDGTKAPSITWGGGNFGVQAILAAPVETGPRALVANHAIASGRRVGVGALLLPAAVDPQQAIRERYIDRSRGRLGDGVAEDVALRLQALGLLRMLADVAAAGARQAVLPYVRAAHLKELELLRAYADEAAEDLKRHLALIAVSIENLTRDAASQSTKVIERRLAEQRGVIGRQAEHDRTMSETLQAMAQAIAQVNAAGLEEHTMANIQSFRRPTAQIVELKAGSRAFTPAWIERGLEKVRGKGAKPFFIVFGAGSFSRYVDSVTTTSPFFAEVSRARGLANDEGGPSKLMAPLGVSGLGPLMRQLESLSELGARAGAPVEVAIVDSPGNRTMLMRAIQQDRARPVPRVAWQHLRLVPAAMPVDQGEGLQVQYRDADGSLKPLSEYNPVTGRIDKPVMRPSGELGAFLAGIQAAQTANIAIADRTIVPVYADDAVLFSHPDFVAALLGHAGEADLTGVTVTHQRAGDQWAPSGGVWPEAVWPDGTTALVVAERNVRDPNAIGVFNPALDRDEMAAAPAYFPFNAAAPVFSGRFVQGELLNPDRMSRRLSSKRITIATGPGTSEARAVLQTELELTESAQLATQRAAADAPTPWRAQIVETEDRRYQAVKVYAGVEPVNQALFAMGADGLRSLLGDRVSGDLRFVEISPRFTGFSGTGRLVIEDGVGIVLDTQGLWAHDKITPPPGTEAPTLFNQQGRLVVAAGADGTIRLDGTVRAAPTTGLEESLEDVLEAFEGRMRGWHNHAMMPIVLLSDRTATFGINSGRYDATETARRLRSAGVPPEALRQLLDALEQDLRRPPQDRVVGARAAAIDLSVAAQRMARMGLSPAEALRSARVRIQGTDGWRGHRTPNEQMFTILGSGRLSPELVEIYHASFIEWAIAQGLMRRGDRYVLGYDPRDDAEIAGIPPGSYTKAAIRGAQRAGATVVDVGVVPIWAAPLYMVWSGATACGVITASHNPKDDTGNKLFVGPALKLFPEDDFEISAHFFRNLGRDGWKPEKNDLPAYRRVEADQEDHAAAIRVAEETALVRENSWAQEDRPLGDWLVVVDPARGAYAGRAADPEHPKPDDPQEFGILSRSVAGLGATVFEVGKNLGRGNVNEGSGVGQFEGAGLLVVSREDVREKDILRDHEMFGQMFAVATQHRTELQSGQKRLAGIMSDADGDRLYMLIYDAATDTIVIMSGDETAFVQATFLLQAAPPAWRAAFTGAGFATTVESDFFAADAAATLGLTKEYTGVGDKWILLQAVTALLRATIGHLEQTGGVAIRGRLARIKADVERLGGASMRMAAAVQAMQQLDALAAEARVDLEKFLMTPGAIKSAVVTEESGHNVTALYITTKDGRRLPVFIGSGMKSAINTLAAFQALFPTPGTRHRTIDGRDVTWVEFAREPFVHGHKRTHYAFYVDKTRLLSGSPAWTGLSNVIQQGVPRVFGPGYNVVERPRADEPDMLYFVVQHDGQDVGAVFARPSGTENKASLYVRGRRDLEGQFNRLGAMVEVAANEVLGDRSSPSLQARELMATRLRAAGQQPVLLGTLREAVRTEVRASLGSTQFDDWWKLFWKEMTEKAKVFASQGDQVTLVSRALQPGDRDWVYQHATTTTAGMEEAAETTGFDVDAARQALGQLRSLAVPGVTVPTGVGIIAGPELINGVSGIAHAIVLHQQTGVPVVLLAESQEQRQQLLATEFFSEAEIVVGGTGALEMAEQRLMAQGVSGTGFVYLGVPNQPSVMSLEDLLAKLGIDLSAYPISLLQYRAAEIAKQVLGQYV